MIKVEQLENKLGKAVALGRIPSNQQTVSDCQTRTITKDLEVLEIELQSHQ